MYQPIDFFPVMTEDPFLKYRPFPENPSNYFEAHWHEIAASFLFYVVIQYISAFSSKYIFGDTYTKLDRKTKVNFDIHIVSQVQCVISIYFVVNCWYHPMLYNYTTDPVTSIVGYYPFGGLVAAATTGYFLWDTYVCLAYFLLFGTGFLFHGLAALYVFGTALIPFCLPWVPAFLLFEVSTPFVNMNWFASKLPAGTFSDKFVMINGLILMVVFFVVRILWGFYAVSRVAVALWHTRHLLNPFFPVVVLSLNMMLNSLNVFWFYKMVKIAQKKARALKLKKE